MANETRKAVLLKDVRALFGFGVAGDATDRQLLEQFLSADRPDAEAAFTHLVERHGPMVLQVCRQVLDDSHDAQDAFQATFLVFLRRARSIRKRESLASWLFGVAMRVARRARYAAITRRFHEQKAADFAKARAPASAGPSESLAALHAELARLPQRYREPILLCHLQGLSIAAAAQRLGCPRGTILSRLARGRERLRQRLSRQGQGESLGLLAMIGAPTPGSWPAFVNGSVPNSVRALSARAVLSTTVSPSVAVLTHATLRTLFMTRIVLAGAFLSTAAIMTVVTIPLFRASLRADAQAASAGNMTRKVEETTPKIDEALPLSRDPLDILYGALNRDHRFDDPRWPFVITVRDVEKRTLIDATFKHRSRGNGDQFDTVIQARRCVLRLHPDAKIVRALLELAEVQRFSGDADVVLIKNDVLEIPIPPDVQAPSVGVMVRMDSDRALSLDYSRDGKTIATAGFDGAVHLWDAMRGTQIVELNDGKKSTIRSVTFTPDGQTVACVNDTGFVRLWDVATGTLKRSFFGLSEPMRQAARRLMLDSIAFAPDGRTLAVSGFGPSDADSTDRIYELGVFDMSGQPKWSHMGRGEQACSLAFAPDGATLARGGWRTVVLWNATDGEPARTL